MHCVCCLVLVQFRKTRNGPDMTVKMLTWTLSIKYTKHMYDSESHFVKMCISMVVVQLFYYVMSLNMHVTTWKISLVICIPQSYNDHQHHFICIIILYAPAAGKIFDVEVFTASVYSKAALRICVCASHSKLLFIITVNYLPPKSGVHVSTLLYITCTLIHLYDKCYGTLIIVTASANSVDFSGIRPQMYIQDLL